MEFSISVRWFVFEPPPAGLHAHVGLTWHEWEWKLKQNRAKDKKWRTPVWLSLDISDKGSFPPFEQVWVQQLHSGADQTEAFSRLHWSQRNISTMPALQNMQLQKWHIGCNSWWLFSYASRVQNWNTQHLASHYVKKTEGWTGEWSTYGAHTTIWRHIWSSLYMTTCSQHPLICYE